MWRQRLVLRRGVNTKRIFWAASDGEGGRNVEESATLGSGEEGFEDWIHGEAVGDWNRHDTGAREGAFGEDDSC